MGKKEYSNQDEQERFNENHLGNSICVPKRLKYLVDLYLEKSRKVKAYTHLAAVKWLLRSSRRGGCMANGLHSQSLGEERMHKCFLCSPSRML